MKKLIMFFICLGFAATASGQFVSDVSKVGVTAAPFLEIRVGARAIAMGSAFVGTADDASALYWNPAGIAKLNRPEAILVHTKWIADISFDYVGLVLPIGSFGTLGASVTSLSMDDMMVKTVDQPNGTGEYFGAGDIAMALTYAFNVTDRLSIGFTGKYIQQHIWNESAWGVGFDIGTLFTTGFRGMRIGATLSNFGTDMKMSGKDLLVYHDIDESIDGNNDRIFAELKTETWPLSLNFQIGVAMEVLNNEVHRITLASDALHPSDNTESINVGMEYALREMFFFRAGYQTLFMRDTEEGLTLGGGINMKFMRGLKLRLDYAYADFGRLQNAQQLTLRIQF
ncbi:PorV/PorQ family protein [bacterium]|nr:PorV/PorQ family protein [bacterium]